MSATVKPFIQAAEYALYARMEMEKLGVYGSAFGNVFLYSVFDAFPNAVNNRP
jgi:hypothetical protein